MYDELVNKRTVDPYPGYRSSFLSAATILSTNAIRIEDYGHSF